MREDTNFSVLEKVRSRFRSIVEKADIANTEVTVIAKPLTPEEAIGTPDRRDYPIVTGKERVIEAQYQGAIGHAFTDMPGNYRSTIGELLALNLTDNARRAFFVASLNAVYRHLVPETKTVHCKDEDPERCGKKIAEELYRRFGRARIGFIGLNPAILENLATTFNPENVFAVDLNPQAIGKKKFGVLIRDGRTEIQTLVDNADILLVTGTTIGNATADGILSLSEARGKPCIFYGVTIAATACLLGFERLCPCAV
ncbi:MAG: hypothetical protein GY847_07840 [Proteobacteria bacterium]|nr:hypothetical protein [Pseudomonadota bacterium]